MAKRGVHDMGGEPAGPLDLHQHAPTLTERRIDAMMQLLRVKPRGFWTTDENRRTIESLTPEVYEGSSYYARWTLAMRGLLIEKGVLSEAEITKRFKEIKARALAAAKAAAGTTKPKAAKSKPSGKKAAKAAKLAAPSKGKTKTASKTAAKRSPGA